MTLARRLRHLALVACCLAGTVAATGSAAQAATLTYGSEPKSTDLHRFVRWVDALNKHVADMRGAPARCSAGDQAYCFLMNYDRYLQSIVGASPLDQIEAVNRFVNQIPYVEDEANYQVSDYWASPLEFFRNSGDCEDFAIAKYVAFRRLGFTDDQVRVWIVRDDARGIDHAVVTVAMFGNTYVLDSLNDQVLDASAVTRYSPIYSINASAWWLHDASIVRRTVAAGADGN